MPSNCNTKYCNALVVMLRRHSSMTFREILELTGYPSSVVGNIINRRCPDTITRKHMKDFDLDQMAHEYRDLGMTSYELGEKYGVNHTAISKWMRSLGINKGKPTSFPDGNANGRGAAILKDRCKARVEKKLADEGGVLELVGYGKRLTLRCTVCGHVFEKSKGGYQHRFTCPECAAREIEQAAEQRRRRDERRLAV